MLAHLTVWSALVVGFSIGAILIATLYSWPNMKDNEWTNFWQVFGAIIGGYISYRVAKYTISSEIQQQNVKDEIKKIELIIAKLTEYKLFFQQAQFGLIESKHYVLTKDDINKGKRKLVQSGPVSANALFNEVLISLIDYPNHQIKLQKIIPYVSIMVFDTLLDSIEIYEVDKNNLGATHGQIEREYNELDKEYENIDSCLNKIIEDLKNELVYKKLS